MKNKILIIMAVASSLLFLTGVYAGFTLRQDITATANTTTNWNVAITNVTTKTLSGSAKNNSEPTFNSLTATFDVSFTKYNDYAEYEITVTNNGDLTAKLNSLISSNSASSTELSYSGITEGETLSPGASKTFTVKLLYKEGLSSGTAALTLDYIQA